MSTSDDGTIDESTPGDASRRAVEDYEEAPGTEQAVDFPDAGRRLGGIAQDVLDVPPRLPAPEETDLVSQRLWAGYAGYKPVPALDVEVSITTPDGRSFSFREGREFPEPASAENFVDDELILLLFEVLSQTVWARFKTPGGSAIYEHGTARPIKDIPQA